MITRDVARATLELTSPLSIGRGEASHQADLPFAVDCNGLPTIPGTSLAGVLRAHAEGVWNTERLEAVFGSRGGEALGESQLSVSFGHLHDSRDRPIPARATEERLQDPLLRQAREGVVRTHVRLDHRGTADHRGLFDEQLVPRGHRFTVELELRDRDAADLDEILAFLAQPEVRLGARTRSGLGSFRVVSVHRRRFVLDDTAGHPRDWADYARLPVDVAAALPAEILPPAVPRPVSPSGLGETAVLDLEASGSWLIGNGTPLSSDMRSDAEGGPRVPDRAPWREPRVVWSRTASGEIEGRAELENPELVVPGSAIKGALRHRTAYYLNGLLDRWADQLAPAELTRNSAHELVELRELFGHVPTQGSSGQRAKAGRVVVEEAVVSDATIFWQDHVSLDRFTQGPMPGALFDEAVCFGGRWQLRVHVAPPSDSGEAPVESKAVQALKLAVEDLAEGRLQVGSGSGRGHGYFRGTLKWEGSDDAQ